MSMSKVQQFAIRKNYKVHTDNGVRICTQRQLEKTKFKPAKGSQVFVGRLPEDAYEDEIYNFFSVIGPIYQIKLILKLSGLTRGFAFVTFALPELATRAVAELNGRELRYNHPLYVCLSTDYRTLIMKNAVGQNASPQQIKTIFSKVAKIVQVNEVNPSTYAIEFSEHHFAYRALKEFRDSKTEIWGPSVEISWENQNDERNESDDQKRLIKQLTQDLTQLYQNMEREASRRQLIELDAECEAASRRQLNVSLEEREASSRRQLNESTVDSLNSPDSGIATCQGSPSSLSPPRERLVVFPNHADAARYANLHLPGSGGALPPIQEGAAAFPLSVDTASTVKLHLPGSASWLPFMDNALAPITVDDTDNNSRLPGFGQNRARGLTNQGSNIGTSRPSLPPYADADSLKIILPQYLPVDNQTPPFKNSRLSSAYRTASQDQIENILPRYLPADKQPPPFEASRLASAYRSAPPGFEESSIRQHGNQTSALELPRAQTMHVETDKYKNNAAQFVPLANQGAKPHQTQVPKLASAHRSPLRGCAKQHENQATSLTEQAVAGKVENVLPRYMLADKQTHPFEKSRLSSAYRNHSAASANSMQHVGEEMASSLLDEDSPAQSRDQIENILPRYLPTDNQPPPFEASRLTSAYRRGFADQIENILSRYLATDNQTPRLEASRLSSAYRSGSAVAPLPYEMGRGSYKGRFMNPKL